MDTNSTQTPDAQRTAGSLHRDGYAALVESWRACAKSLAENYLRLRACVPDAADRAIARAEIYAQCAERLEQEMRRNDKLCNAADADLAMQKGVNYPLGPLAWAERIGIDRVLRVLQNLGAEYGEDRYRVSPLIRRKVASGQGRFG